LKHFLRTFRKKINFFQKFFFSISFRRNCKFSASSVFFKKIFLIFFLKLDEKLHKMTEVLFLISIFYFSKKWFQSRSTSIKTWFSGITFYWMVRRAYINSESCSEFYFTHLCCFKFLISWNKITQFTLDRKQSMWKKWKYNKRGPPYISTTFLDLSCTDEFKNICNYVHTITVQKLWGFRVLNR